MGTIVTISGPSGSGKTTLVDQLLSRGPKYHWIPSVTSRAPRERDVEGEFLYRTSNQIEECVAHGEFLWITPPIHGTQYGTLKQSLEEAFCVSGFHLMMITLEYIEVLAAFAGRNASRVVNVHLLSPGEEVLRERLRKRGESEENIERRLLECRDWDEKARTLRPVPHLVTNNESDLEHLFAQVDKVLAPFNAS